MNGDSMPPYRILLCIVVMLVAAAVIVTYGMEILFPTDTHVVISTEYDIISIDNERFMYIDSNNKIRGVVLSDGRRFVDVYTSNRTYLVIEGTLGTFYTQYILYLNVSDLE